MDQNYNLDHNYADCLKEVYGLVSRDVHNVCTGEVVNVPYGLPDYALLVLVLITVVSLSVGVAGLIYYSIK